jgi:hypothetical protein
VFLSGTATQRNIGNYQWLVDRHSKFRIKSVVLQRMTLSSKQFYTALQYMLIWKAGDNNHHMAEVMPRQTKQ